MLSSHTGQSEDEINEDTERDNFMSADEAMEYGIVDEVIHPRSGRATEVKK